MTHMKQSQDSDSGSDPSSLVSAYRKEKLEKSTRQESSGPGQDSTDVPNAMAGLQAPLGPLQTEGPPTTHGGLEHALQRLLAVSKAQFLPQPQSKATPSKTWSLEASHPLRRSVLPCPASQQRQLSPSVSLPRPPEGVVMGSWGGLLVPQVLRSCDTTAWGPFGEEAHHCLCGLCHRERQRARDRNLQRTLED